MKALKNFEIKSKTVLDCYRNLQRLCLHNQVNLIWVPGHRGIEGNEKADELARLGAEGEGLSVHLAPPIQHFKIMRDSISLANANRKWRELTSCKISRIFWPTYNIRKTKFLLSLSRNECRILTGFITGHCLVGKHAKRMGHISDSNCRRCDEGVEETIEHIMCHCPALARCRHSIMGRHSFENLEDAARVDIRILRHFAVKADPFRLRT